MSSESLKGILTVKYALIGTALRAIEEQTWIHSIDFLDECEGDCYHVYKACLDQKSNVSSGIIMYIMCIQLEKLAVLWMMC